MLLPFHVNLLRHFNTEGRTYHCIGVWGWCCGSKRCCSAVAIHQWWTLASEQCHWPLQTLMWYSHFPVSRFRWCGKDTLQQRSHLEWTPCRWVGSRCTGRRPAHTGWYWLTGRYQCGTSVPPWRSADLSHISGSRGRHPRIVVGCSQRNCNCAEYRIQYTAEMLYWRLRTDVKRTDVPSLSWWLKVQWMSLALVGDRKSISPQKLLSNYPCTFHPFLFLHHYPLSESEYKCLTCNQKPTGSQFSLLHEWN